MDLELKKVILVYEKDGKEIPVEFEDEELGLLIKLFNMATYFLMAHDMSTYEKMIEEINQIIKKKLGI